MQEDNKQSKFSIANWLFPKKNKDEQGDKSTKRFANKKFLLCIAGILFLIIIGIFVSSFSSGSQSKTQTLKNASNTALGSGKEYVTDVENRLSTILNSVKGISNVEVFISVNSSPKITYAEDITESENNGNKTVKSSIVLSKDGTITTPVVIVEYYPEITGILIVAKGAGDVKTKLMLADTISAVLRIPSSCIQILEGR